jgi:Na+/H+ antiporter NhaD/arsenite permease-like protein
MSLCVCARREDACGCVCERERELKARKEGWNKEKRKRGNKREKERIKDRKTTYLAGIVELMMMIQFTINFSWEFSILFLV